MNLLIVLCAVSSIGYASSSGVTIGLHPELHPIHSLYHSQSLDGLYRYGYATPMLTRNEERTVDGVTRGGYSYMDSNGILQTVKYTSDSIHGFQVAASNLPQDLPDVAAAKAKHMALFRTIATDNAVGVQLPQVVLPQPVQDLPEVVAARQAHLAALEAARNGIMPQPVQDTPEVAQAKSEHLAILEATRLRDESLRAAISLSPVPQNLNGNVVSVSQSGVAETPVNSYTPAAQVSQSGAVDSLGLYSYGYVGPLSSQLESRNRDGITRGGYSYIDANGKLQTVKYIADDINGFRVQATNLPTPILQQNIQENLLDQTRGDSDSVSISAPEKTNSIVANRGGFLINAEHADNSINNVLYNTEVQY